jgi:hypothetical protein
VTAEPEASVNHRTPSWVNPGVAGIGMASLLRVAVRLGPGRSR